VLYVKSTPGDSRVAITIWPSKPCPLASCEAVEAQAFHRVASECRCLKAVHLSVIEVPAQVSLRAPKPANHICPREQKRYRYVLLRRIVRMPTI
jgi:hypothetical protein